MAGLKKTEEKSRTLKIHLNSKLKMDSNSVDYNLHGTVICGDFVKHVEHIRLSDTHVITLSDDIVVSRNPQEDCLKLYRTVSPKQGGLDYSESMLLPIKYIVKVEL